MSWSGGSVFKCLKKKNKLYLKSESAICLYMNILVNSWKLYRYIMIYWCWDTTLGSSYISLTYIYWQINYKSIGHKLNVWQPFYVGNDIKVFVLGDYCMTLKNNEN